MKIAISINEVLRDFIGQLLYTYKKYIGELDLKEGDVTNFNLIEFFKFDDLNKLNSFIYLETPLEIFGHADQLHDGIITQFNEFLLDIEYENQHQVELVSREVNKAIPATFFFLSKTNARPNNLRFVKKYEDKWDGVDVLITANPIALKAKPEGKISVKIKASYNADTPADYEIDSISEFFKDEDLRNKILNTKIITTKFEELK